MSIEGQGHFFTIYFPGFVCFVLLQAKISGERLHDHWSSGIYFFGHCDTYWHANNFAGQFQKTKQKYSKLTYHIDQKPLGIFIN